VPISNGAQIVPILGEILRVNPDKILDIGCGFGLYGALCRNYQEAQYGRMTPKTWKNHIYGVEGWEKYRNPAWEMYDEVFILDYRRIYQAFRDYPLILMIDSLEHAEKTEALTILEYLVRANDRVIVSVPVGECQQGAEFGNDLECHRSSWTIKDFEPFLRVEGSRVLMDKGGFAGTPLVVSLKRKEG
jgi:hypothetical protein